MLELSTCLWFSGRAEEAAEFYVSIFKDGKILETSRYPEEAARDHGRPTGSVLFVGFEILGRRFMAMNAEPLFQFNEAVSFIVECETQAEIDYYWERLTAGGGQEVQCGWLKDKFGVVWQVTPKALLAMMTDPDPAKVARVTAAFGPMKKLELAAIEKAYRGEGRS